MAINYGKGKNDLDYDLGAGAVAVIPVSRVKLPVFTGVKTEDWFQERRVRQR